MAWYDQCENPEVVRAYYAAPPALDRLALHEVVLHRDGPVLRLRGNLPVFPDRPSRRWPEHANAAQITLALWGVTEVRIREWATVVEGAFTLERLASQRLAFRFASDVAALSGECFAARIEGISGYLTGDG